VKTIYLVSCVKKKAKAPAPACELYRSEWFQNAKRYVFRQLQSGDHWFVLSAEHYLLEPGAIIAPYDKTLASAGKAARQLWAKQVLTQLHGVLKPRDRIVILAGKNYREFLEPELTRAHHEVQVPMRGLDQIRQKEWLRHQLRESPGPA